MSDCTNGRRLELTSTVTSWRTALNEQDFGPTRTVTIPLETADFDRLERLAIKNNVGNATLGREIIRKYLKRQADEVLTLS